ncbi:LpxI family protein [Candidatus Phycosocius spiralis]|uniref:UDP-2,3-diacylglucosamine pyrophosphatase n=1 Tax=Candidatus Phycosocius spiralis TaxID=2815099 RepID=A0ABQ4PT75_9PROT|nr:UDP-2,3-diacylglucosamine diphosphatase LpxI [Candidatus Phycosocius spiralis]GIU66114.1 UDP-2,3-diacylglucosamine pyrophosphatase [Candidatus Phycosocius spiralis]
MGTFSKLGIIAGAGDLPLLLAQHCQEAGLGVHVSRIKGVSDPSLALFPGIECGLARVGERIKALKADQVDALVFAGLVNRPDLKSLKPDMRGALALTRIVPEMSKGDDALLRAVIAEFEREGFKIVGTDDVLAALLATEGLIAGHMPTPAQTQDCYKAFEVAGEIGQMDIGQGVVVVDGLVLAVEAQEGTDRMLARVHELSSHLRGTRSHRRGVLAKRAKPNQERRVDLPTIGVKTVEGAAKAGLAGMVVEAGGALIIDKTHVIAAAEEAGLFILGMAVDVKT